jgi:phosphatidylinositol alpha-1,6-mannosyltransferase
VRIALISTFKSMGGISVHTRELYREFRKRNHEVTVIPETDWPALIATEHYLATLSKGFDIVNVQGSSDRAAIIAGLLASKGPVGACVCTSHGFSPPRWYARSVWRSVMRGTLKRYGAVISISKFVEQRLSQFFGPERPNMFTVYDGVDAELFAPTVDSASLRERLGLADKRVILYVGRMTEKKGVHHLLRAFSMASGQVPGLSLVYCGAGSMDQPLRTMANELGLGDKVVFAGAVPHQQLPAYYAMCDVLAVPSIKETLGLAPLEAMSCGRPVVASDTGGLPEIVEHLQTGLLVPPGDPASLAHALLVIIRDEELASKLGREGRIRVLERYTLGRCAEATIGAYGAALGHGSRFGAPGTGR